MSQRFEYATVYVMECHEKAAWIIAVERLSPDSSKILRLHQIINELTKENEYLQKVLLERSVSCE